MAQHVVAHAVCDQVDALTAGGLRIGVAQECRQLGQSTRYRVAGSLCIVAIVAIAGDGPVRRPGKDKDVRLVARLALAAHQRRRRLDRLPKTDIEAVDEQQRIARPRPHVRPQRCKQGLRALLCIVREDADGRRIELAVDNFSLAEAQVAEIGRGKIRPEIPRSLLGHGIAVGSEINGSHHLSSTGWDGLMLYRSSRNEMTNRKTNSPSLTCH
ncbi:hypothetical protein SDC9_187857 [bioreactor metagenome]|uniref:Uncharacterized protein n=1 Tax=bioreactor metagenome TaxID=1076179 RepID=A0A645HMN9_9ZZZZ